MQRAEAVHTEVARAERGDCVHGGGSQTQEGTQPQTQEEACAEGGDCAHGGVSSRARRLCTRSWLADTRGGSCRGAEIADSVSLTAKNTQI